MTLVAGSYERFLFGFEYADLGEDGASLKKRFSMPAHQGPVKCVAARGSWIVTGGADDQLHIFAADGQKDHGFLVNPGEGAVTCVELFAPPGEVEPSHLLSGSEDGSLHVWSVGGGWEHMRALRGHRSTVHSVSIHPSGKVALSVAHDRHLRLWDLVRGRCQYTSPLEAETDTVRFFPDGARYALVAGRRCVVQTVDGGVVGSLEAPSRVSSCTVANTAVLCGCDDGTVRLWDPRAPPTSAAALRLDKPSRVRGLALPGLADWAASPTFVAAANSAGALRVLDLRAVSWRAGEEPAEARSVCAAETGARITGLCVAERPDTAAQASASAAALLGPSKAAGRAGGATPPSEGKPGKAVRTKDKGRARASGEGSDVMGGGGHAKREEPRGSDEAGGKGAGAEGKRKERGGKGSVKLAVKAVGGGVKKPGKGSSGARKAEAPAETQGGTGRRMARPKTRLAGLGVDRQEIEGLARERAAVWGSDKLAGAELAGLSGKEAKRRVKKAKELLKKKKKEKEDRD